ncbi:TonB-dependent receptor [Phocaeicola oris]|uniref:TonB-dependent receptor n=1 Tax=Phocaeicola oris TaxID=2896850 RepID=UPI00234EB2AD|nr:TonB-dependent receptor [Phocaeicola oris]MCE2616709.1 TonB-dependent receptor [Phocaeicola oris]
MIKKNNWNKMRAFPLIAILLMFAFISTANAQQKYSISGVVYELSKGQQIPLDFATVYLPDYGAATTTAKGGRFTINNLPAGMAKITISYVGKIQIETHVSIQSNITDLSFVMKDEDFRLEEVVVTAKNNVSGKATSSSISRQAMDHLQATSLSDLLSLAPGGISENYDLNNSKTIKIRQVMGGAGTTLNSLGAAIIQDGSPISNNANLSALNPTVNGSAGALAGGSSPNSGFDVRSISIENVEKVEIIRGIPSAEYGDLTSGAVIIHSKAGKEPLHIKAKANPNVYQGSIGSGIGLGKRGGILNLSGDYAYNIKNPTESYDHYQRFTTKALYSNTLFNVSSMNYNCL